MSVALRRAKHLASDLVDDGLADLVTRHIVDAPLAERHGQLIAAEPDREDETEVIAAARELDRLLRSLEHGARMPELPFGALVTREVPAAESRVALTISGRNVVVAGRGGDDLG